MCVRCIHKMYAREYFACTINMHRLRTQAHTHKPSCFTQQTWKSGLELFLIDKQKLAFSPDLEVSPMAAHRAHAQTCTNAHAHISAHSHTHLLGTGGSGASGRELFLIVK